MTVIVPRYVPMSVHQEIGQLLGLQIESDADLVRLAKHGISVHSFKEAARAMQIQPSAIIPKATLRRREAKKQPLSPEETERLVRMARVYAKARSLYGDGAEASDWLNTAADFLNDGYPVTPYELAGSEAGARWVETLIRRTAYGFVA